MNKSKWKASSSFSLRPLGIIDATKACRASGLLQFMPRFFFVLSLIHWFCLLLVLLHLQVLQPNKIMRWEKDISCPRGALISFWSDTSQIGHQLLCYLRLIHQSIYFDFKSGSCLLLQEIYIGGHIVYGDRTDDISCSKWQKKLAKIWQKAWLVLKERNRKVAGVT